MLASTEKSSLLERAQTETAKEIAMGSAVENIYQLITGHSVDEIKAMTGGRKKSFYLAEKYFDRGRGRLSQKGKQQSQEIFTQLVEKYGQRYSATEILTLLKEVYTYAVVETGHNNENRTFQLLIASLRGKVLFYREQFKPKPGENVEDKKAKGEKRSIIPKKIKRILKRTLIGVTLGLAAAVPADLKYGFSPYLHEIGKAVLGAEYEAADLDQDLRDQITGGRSREVEEVPAWLLDLEESQPLSQPPQSDMSRLFELDLSSRTVQPSTSNIFELDLSAQAPDEVEESEQTPFELDVLQKQPRNNLLSTARSYLRRLLSNRRADLRESTPENTEVTSPIISAPTTAPEETMTVDPTQISSSTPLPTQTAETITATPSPTSTEASTQTPTQPPTEETTSPTTTPVPTETVQATPTSEPLSSPEAVVLSPEVDTVMEYIFGGEFYQAVTEARETRAGLRTLDVIPAGYKQVTEGGATFLVPEDLPSYLNYVYSPATFARSLGANQVPAAERQRFLENKINDGMIHIGISGLDYRTDYSRGDNGFIGRTDAPMIMSVNIQTGQITLTSIARDTWSPEVAWLVGGGESNRPNQEISVMSWFHGDPIRQTDPAFSRMIYENICGCAIDGVVQMNFDAAADLIDQLFPQGIPITVEEDINDRDFLNIEAGDHMVDGETAVKLARSRYTAVEGDLSRQGYQRQVMMAVMSGVVSEFKNELLNGDPEGAIDIFNQFLQTTDTAFSEYEQSRQALDEGTRTAAQEPYLRSFGLSPHILLTHLDSVRQQLQTPEGIGVLTAIGMNPEGRQQLFDLRSGESFVIVQITTADTNPNATLGVNYWAPARVKIAAAHQDQQ